MKLSLSLAGCALGGLLLAGCGADSGVRWGEEAGGGGAEMGSAVMATSGERIGTGGVSANLAAATAEVIAIGEASQRQRDLAAERARAYRRAHPKAPRYLAVGSGRRVLIYDTATGQAGTQLYALKAPIPAGTLLHAGKIPVLYIGS